MISVKKLVKGGKQEERGGERRVEGVCEGREEEGREGEEGGRRGSNKRLGE